MDKFLEYLRVRVSKSTYENYRRLYEKLKVWGLEDREETYQKIRQLKSTRQNNYIRVLNHYEKWMGSDKTWKRIKVRVEDQREKEEYLRLEDILKMIRGAKTIRVKTEIGIMYGTGIRVGELVKIKHKNIDGVGRKIVGVKAKGNKRTNAYFLDNYFYDLVVDYLTWKRNNELYKELCKDEDYLFCDGSGKPYREETIWHNIKHAAKVLENKKSISPHTLRHSFVYAAMEKGIPQDAISKNIGHASTQITEQVYTHYTQDLQQKRFFGPQSNNQKMNKICPNCGFNEIQEDFILCPQCQHRFLVLCDPCRHTYKVNYKACPYCGLKNPFFIKEIILAVTEKKLRIK